MSDELVESGLRYCTAHNGVIDCDEDVCDFVDYSAPEHACALCEGSGVDPTNPDEQCVQCDGEGVTACTPTPLLYRSGGGA